MRRADVGGTGHIRIIPVSHRPYNHIFSLFQFFEREEGKALGEALKVGDFLAALYPWTKTLHVVSVIAWMAGLFYLPRLFVYHAEAVERGGTADELFQTMERRLLRAIMNPAMAATWLFGLILVFTPGVVDWNAVWPWTKTGAVLAMTWFHHWLAARRKDFAAGTNQIAGRRYRMMNEVPTVLLFVIVASVIVKF